MIPRFIRTVTASLRIFVPHIFVWGSCFGCALPSAPPASCLPPPASRRLTHNHTTYSHTSHTHTTYSHTHKSYTRNLLTRNSYTHNLLTHSSHKHNSLTHNSLIHTNLHFAWQAWHLATSTFTLCGRRGSGGALGSRLPPWAPRLFVWQVWHLEASTSIPTFTLCGMRDTYYGTGLALVACLVPVCWQPWHLAISTSTLYGRPLGDIDLHFAWQAWHLWHWAGSGGALGFRLSPLSPWRFVWHAWHLEASTSILFGKRGTWRHRPSLCVAGVTLVELCWLWWRCFCGRCGAWRHRSPLCVEGVALGDIDLRFVWQVWHSWHWAGSGGALGSRLLPWARGCLCGKRGIWNLEASTSILCGRCGTWRHQPFTWRTVRRGNLLRPPRTCCKPSALMTVCVGCSATLRMLPRQMVAIHLCSWCWHVGYGYITYDHPPLIYNLQHL